MSWSTFSAAVDVVLATLIGAIFMLPTAVAHVRRVPARYWIMLVNLALGLTGVGWIVALIWAIRATPEAGGPPAVPPAGNDGEEEWGEEEDGEEEDGEEEDGGPGIAALIGIEEQTLMLFLSRIRLRPLVIALTELSPADLHWLVNQHHTRASLLLLEEVEAMRPVAPDDLARARRTVAALIRRMVKAGELPGLPDTTP